MIRLVTTSIGGQPEIPVQMELVHQYLTAVGFEVELVEIEHARVGAIGRARGALLSQSHPQRSAPADGGRVPRVLFESGGPYQGWEDDWTART